MSEYITDAEIDEMVRRLEAHVAVDIRTALRDAVLWGARYAEVRQQSKSGGEFRRMPGAWVVFEEAAEPGEAPSQGFYIDPQRAEHFAGERGFCKNHLAEVYIREPHKPNSPEHVCGASGYNGMIDPPCPGCQRSSERG